MDKLKEEINRLMKWFEKSFINPNNELILVPSTNLYFGLDNVDSAKTLKCKVIAWCSRDACKSTPYSANWRNAKYQAEIRMRLNGFLKADFSAEEWRDIYTYLGNDIRGDLCEKFVDSGYDINVIRSEVG